MYFLGDRIRDLRENADLKQKDLAQEFSINENTWSQYETNKRTPDMGIIKKIADYFGVSIDYLLNLTNEKYNPREEEFKELIHIFNRLSKKEKKELVDKIKRWVEEGER